MSKFFGNLRFSPEEIIGTACFQCTICLKYKNNNGFVCGCEVQTAKRLTITRLAKKDLRNFNLKKILNG